MKTPPHKSLQLGSMRYYSFPDFPAVHGFFTRQGGVSAEPYATLNTAIKTGDDMAPQNRTLLLRSLALQNNSLAILRPNHGKTIRFEDGPLQKSSKRVVGGTDAFFTSVPETYLMVSSADCIILILTTRQLTFAGLVHLGWRNIRQHFATKVMDALIKHYRVSPGEIRVGIGPSIHPCCYRFTDLTQQNDPEWRNFIQVRQDKRFSVDLVAFVRHELIQSGIQKENIDQIRLCTACHNNLFFSAYKEGYVSGRFPTIIGLQKGALSY